MPVYNRIMKTTNNTAALLAYAAGIILDPDPGAGKHWMDEVFECNSSDLDQSVADPDEKDAWKGRRRRAA